MIDLAPYSEDLAGLPLIHRFPHLVFLADAAIGDPAIVDVLAQARAQGLPGRAVRGGCSTVGDVAARTLTDMQDWPNVGPTWLARFLDGLQLLDERAEQVRLLVSPADTDEEQARHVSRALDRIARWARFAHGATTWGDVLRVVTGSLPDDVAAGFQRVHDLVLPDPRLSAPSRSAGSMDNGPSRP